MSQAAEMAQDPSPADFGRFFKEVHGYTPFPWQEELVTRVLDRGWPDLIDVPTGLGKTAVLDVAVFLSALRSDYARRRVFLVVDRRLIVDQAHDEARKIQRALENPLSGSVCARVRAALAAPGDDATSVLDVTRMRGGVNWSWLWIERPDRHAVVTGTVDQVGSRLLFRGYGVGERLRSIDAAMVGTDSLIVIDEAHLSDPFFTTIKDALAMDGKGVGRPPILVAMTASPESEGCEVHGITRADVEDEVAGQRLRAAKALHTVTVPATGPTATPAMADALAYWARQLVGPGKVIGVIANTVHMARLAFERLRAQVGDDSCVLLTGRVRPIDREYLLAEWYPKIKSGANRDASAEIYVVATQTIEAGADIDFDAMVTQSATLSALVQRLGRVNRLGGRDSAPVAVLHADKLADPVYGPAADQTWVWLKSLVEPITHKVGRSDRDLGAGLDASPAILRELVSGIASSDHELMQAARPYVPVISRSTLDTWVRTSPVPHPDVPVAPYLHGIAAGEPTVFVVWRSDVRGDNPEGWAHSLELIPPSADEAIELPVSAVRRWLSRLSGPATSTDSQPVQQVAGDSTSDLESQEPGEVEQAGKPRRGAARRVLRYRGTDDHKAVTAQILRPGDYVIVPSAWGGCDRNGWYPESDSKVTDVADFVGWRGRRAAAIRIGPGLKKSVEVLAPVLLEQLQEFISEVVGDIVTDSTEEDDSYRGRLREMIKGQKPVLPLERVLSRLAEKGHLEVIDRDQEDGGTSERVAGLFAAPGASWNEDGSAAGTSASANGEPMTLADHQAAVGRRAREIAHNLDLSEALMRAVKCAALHHDEGKRDRRFQAMLHGGDHLRARIDPVPLAKSGMDPASRTAFRRAARLSGYPSKMRHEALSARITAAMLEQDDAADLDRDLVVHLVAAHHGCARPLLPAVVDRTPVTVPVSLGDGQSVKFDTAETVDWTGPERFARLCERYGRWGLALLESIVRLADIWCSARSEDCSDRPEANDGQG